MSKIRAPKVALAPAAIAGSVEPVAAPVETPAAVSPDAAALAWQHRHRQLLPARK